jgi:AraC-like DNA-binding protein
MKCHTGDIVLFDDSKPYNYMTNKQVELSVITIHKDGLGEMLPFLENAILHKYKDTEGKLGRISKEIWQEFTSSTPATTYKTAEKRILDALRDIVQTQEAIPPILTKGEEVAFAIREQVYQHMDGNLQVADLAEQYNISKRGLQNAFNSLFGFTPKRFMRQLKLNLVRHDLSQNITSDTTVIKIAHKWGFTHMGRFSKFYTELFEENPSLTLRRSFDDEKSFTGECVVRQEEIE